MSDHKGVLQSLDNIPFSTWKGQIRGYLQIHGLKSFIDTTSAIPSDPTEKATHERGMGKAAGILSLYLGSRYQTQFVNNENENNPRDIWLKIVDHFEAKTGDNQAKVVQEFFAITFKNNDIAGFLSDLNKHLSKISAVGVKIVKEPVEFTLHETWMSEFLLSRLPMSLNLRDILITKRPLTIDILRDLLEGKRRDMAPSSGSSIPTVKLESALVAESNDYPVCSDGVHNPATKHPASKCRQLKKKKKAAKAAASTSVKDDSSSISTTTSGLLCIRQALAAVKSDSVCFLDSGASHHMFSDRSRFKDYRPRSTLISLADGNTLKSAGKGHVTLIANNGTTLKLKALHVPDLAGTLISFGRLFKRGCDVSRTGPNSFDLIRNKAVILSAAVIGGVCNIKLKQESQDQQVTHTSRL